MFWTLKQMKTDEPKATHLGLLCPVPAVDNASWGSQMALGLLRAGTLVWGCLGPSCLHLLASLWVSPNFSVCPLPQMGWGERVAAGWL